MAHQSFFAVWTVLQILRRYHPYSWNKSHWNKPKINLLTTSVHDHTSADEKRFLFRNYPIAN